MAKLTSEQILAKEMLSLYEVASLAQNQGAKIPKQMLYNYARKGYITTIEADGRKMVERDVAIEWIESYFAKQNARSEAKQAKIEAELASETVEA